MTKKALIFDPYFNTVGGGEFYCLAVIDFLLKKNFQVEIAWSDRNLITRIKERFNIDFNNKVIINPKAFKILSTKKNIIQKYWFERKYQLIFYISDGSIPWLFAQKNWLHFQVPFTNVAGKALFNQLKLKFINKVICNSNFVKKFIDREFGVNSQVISPPLNPIFFKLRPIQKENIILSVGRFDERLNSKKQDVLVKVFKKMINRGLRNWQLVLVGGLLIKESPFFLKLQQAIKGYPIKILSNVNFETLINYYQKAKIYWHATGFGENLSKHPEKAEHFGISVVEAMASGAVPVVFDAGGLQEIVRESELRWASVEELMIKSKKLIDLKRFWETNSKKMRQQALKFQAKDFYQQLSCLLK